MEAAMPLEGPHEKGTKSSQKALDRRLLTDEVRDIRWVPVDEIGIHYSTMVVDGQKGYQRPLNPRKIADMVDHFDAQEITAIVVSQRADGSYWVLDGQHRLEALRLLGRQVILADVRHGLTIPQEAWLFYRLNEGPTRVGAWDKFQSRLTSGDAVAAAIVRIVESHGYRLERGGNALKGIAAVASLEKIHKRGYLSDVFDIISVVWRTDRHAIDGPIMEGLALFLHSYRDQVAYDRERLLDVLSITPPGEIIQRHRQLMVEMGRSSQPAILIAMAIRDVFNGKRRSARKLTGPPISGTGKSLGYPGRGGARSLERKSKG